MNNRQTKPAERPDAILDAALKVFSSRGYRVSTVDDIASESEMSKGGVYFHFPGKQAIFIALMDRSAELLRRKVEEAAAREPDPIVRAETALRVVLRTFGKRRALARLFMIEAMGSGSEFQMHVLRARNLFIEIIQSNLDEAVRDGAIAPLDTRLAAQVWFGGVSEVIVHWLLSKEPGRLEDAYEGLRPLFLRSVGAELSNGVGQKG